MNNYHKLCTDCLEKIKPLLDNRTDPEYEELVKLCETNDPLTISDVVYRCQTLFKKLQGNIAPAVELVYVNHPDYQDDCDEIKVDNEKLKADNGNLKSKLAELSKSLELSNVEIEQIKTLGDSTSNKNSMKIQKLEQELSVASNELKECTEKAKSATAKNEELEKKVVTLEKDLKSLQNEITKLKSELADEKVQTTEITKKRDELVLKNIELESKLDEINNSILRTTKKQIAVKEVLNQSKEQKKHNRDDKKAIILKKRRVELSQIDKQKSKLEEITKNINKSKIPGIKFTKDRVNDVLKNAVNLINDNETVGSLSNDKNGNMVDNYEMQIKEAKEQLNDEKEKSKAMAGEIKALNVTIKGSTGKELPALVSASDAMKNRTEAVNKAIVILDEKNRTKIKNIKDEFEVFEKEYEKNMRLLHEALVKAENELAELKKTKESEMELYEQKNWINIISLNEELEETKKKLNGKNKELNAQLDIFNSLKNLNDIQTAENRKHDEIVKGMTNEQTQIKDANSQLKIRLEETATSLENYKSQVAEHTNVNRGHLVKVHELEQTIEKMNNAGIIAALRIENAEKALDSAKKEHKQDIEKAQQSKTADSIARDDELTRIKNELAAIKKESREYSKEKFDNLISEYELLGLKLTFVEIDSTSLKEKLNIMETELKETKEKLNIMETESGNQNEEIFRLTVLLTTLEKENKDLREGLSDLRSVTNNTIEDDISEEQSDNESEHERIIYSSASDDSGASGYSSASGYSRGSIDSIVSDASGYSRGSINSNFSGVSMGSIVSNDNNFSGNSRGSIVSDDNNFSGISIDNIVSDDDDDDDNFSGGLPLGGMVGGAMIFAENTMTILIVTCILLLMYLIYILYFQPESCGYKKINKCGQGMLRSTRGVKYIAC
jgi:hypothetical protein